MPKVSIVLPVYNGEKFIANTVDMIRNTSLQDIEIIIVDDGSKDNSYPICQNYSIIDQRIKVYRKNNEGGVFAARNHGLSKVTGEYVCFCDQDDIIDENIYEKMYQHTKAGQVDIVMCGIGKLVNGNKTVYESLEQEYIDREEERIKLLIGNLFLHTSIYEKTRKTNGNFIWNCMIKRSFIQKHKLIFRRYISSEDDWLFKLDVLSKARKIATMNEILYFWNVNINSETYQSKYVDNLYKKNIELQREVENIARIGRVPEEAIDLFHMHYNCVRYINMLDNEQKADYAFREKIRKINVIKKEPDFKSSLKLRKYYKKVLIRRVVALYLLDLCGTKAAYVFLLIFRKIRMMCVTTSLWIKLEKNWDN